MTPAARPAEREAALTQRWLAGLRGPLRLEDGRALRVIFPGVPGGAAGPDVRGAILDAGGDVLRGDVEVHLLAGGWRAHGHHLDDAYAAVVLHLVGTNDTGALATLHRSGRSVPVLVSPADRAQEAFPPPFTPPCALSAAQGGDTAAVLERLGLRRLRMKAVRVAPLVHDAGAPQALYALALEVLGGPANRQPFAAIARRLPLPALIERMDGAAAGVPRPFAASAELKAVAAALVLRRAGLRPMAAPARRLEAAGSLFARWWPADARPAWPAALTQAKPVASVPGIGRNTSLELAVNAVLPVALAAQIWPEPEIETAWRALASPGTYSKLRRLEGWLGAPFGTAARLQGGILLHDEWCTRGGCGRCPLSG